MDTVNLRVAFTPTDFHGKWNDLICVVVDVLRASSTIVTLLENGCHQVYTLASASDSRALSRKQGYILAGERNGLTLPGFDLGNSPCEVLINDVAEKGVVLTTTNGTRVIKKVSGARKVLIGCFLNAQACCERALLLAHEYKTGIGIICAAEKNAFVLDDAFCAGFLVEEILKVAGQNSLNIELLDSAQAARRIYHGFPDILSAFRASNSGQRLLSIGREDDFRFCSNVDIFTSVPVLYQNSNYWCGN